MSPEQARGKELDARTDLLSFGTVLYEMATGSLPFHGETSGMIFDAILNREATPSLRMNPAMPRDLVRVISKALEKDPEVRYQHASELRADLKRLRRDTTSGKAQAFEEGAERPANWKRTFTVLAAVAVVLLFTAVVFYRSQTNKRRPRGRNGCN